MKKSKKQDVAIAKLNMAIGDIANQLIKNNIKLPRKNPRYANKLGKKPMRGGGAIDNETIQYIKQFLDDNKDTVIQLKNKLILDILELYKYIVEKNSNDVDYEIVGSFYSICTTLLDNKKIIYDNTFNKLYSPSEAIVNDIKYKKDLANIDNTKYILKLINIYYLIFINNTKDTISFENNTTNLATLFKGTLFEENSDIEKNKKNFVGAYDTFKRRIEGDEKIVVEHEVRNDKELPAAAAQPIVSTAEEIKEKLNLKIKNYYNHNLNYLNFLTVMKNKEQNKEIIEDIKNNLKDDDTYKNLKIEEEAIDKILVYKRRGENQYHSIIKDSTESTKLITRIDTYITNVKIFAPVLQKLYDNYYDAITKKRGGNPPPKYKSTGRIVCIIYKKRKYKRTVYVKDKRNTKYCKIDGEYILLSKMKVIKGH